MKWLGLKVISIAIPLSEARPLLVAIVFEEEWHPPRRKPNTVC
jgi:hypothetical protein